MEQIQIAFLGTGLMGAPMAINLLKAGYPLTAWNRTRQKAEPLKQMGAEIASRPSQAVNGADIIITMLSDGSAVDDILFNQGVARAMKNGATFIDMSSIKPEEARQFARKLSHENIDCLDAPVSGGTKGAKEASLAIMVGGKQSVFDRAFPVLNKLGRPVRVGQDGAGQMSKLANQAIVAVTIGAVAEAMLFAKNCGGDPQAIRAALKGGFADSLILQHHGERMITGNFEPGGLSKLQLKDLDNVLGEAKKNGLALPLIEQVQSRFKRLVDELDGAQKDHSALYLELLDHNSLKK